MYSLLNVKKTFADWCAFYADLVYKKSVCIFVVCGRISVVANASDNVTMACNSIGEYQYVA